MPLNLPRLNPDRRPAGPLAGADDEHWMMVRLEAAQRLDPLAAGHGDGPVPARRRLRGLRRSGASRR